MNSGSGSVSKSNVLGRVWPVGKTVSDVSICAVDSTGSGTLVGRETKINRVMSTIAPRKEPLKRYRSVFCCAVSFCGCFGFEMLSSGSSASVPQTGGGTTETVPALPGKGGGTTVVAPFAVPVGKGGGIADAFKADVFPGGGGGFGCASSPSDSGGSSAANSASEISPCARFNDTLGDGGGGGIGTGGGTRDIDNFLPVLRHLFIHSPVEEGTGVQPALRLLIFVSG